jgi:formate hydrogenlyase subunit 4
MSTIISILLAVILAPLYPGIVNQTKAFFGGRQGPGLFRLYADLFKLLRKSCIRPENSSWVFDIAQNVSLASVLVAAIVFPWTGGSGITIVAPAVLFFYLLAVGRFFTVIGAMDAGNAFEGMGASREMQFSALAEPIVFIVLGFLIMVNGDFSLSGTLSGVSQDVWQHNTIPLILIFVAFLAIFLLENCRVPFDDPETHLELTMIHEAMLLDVGGPDMAFALYAAALKFELLAAFLLTMLVPPFANPLLQITFVFVGIILVAIMTGVIESIMARYRFFKTPQILLGATLIASLAVFFLACF